jgi:hypothetical protein
VHPFDWTLESVFAIAFLHLSRFTECPFYQIRRKKKTALRKTLFVVLKTAPSVNQAQIGIALDSVDRLSLRVFSGAF